MTLAPAIAPIHPPSHAAAAGCAVVLLLLVLPVLVILAGRVAGALRRERRTDEPVCGRCGYSRIGLSGSICPECGSDCRVVGTGRVVRSSRGALGAVSACVAWVLLVVAFEAASARQTYAYMFRLLYGYDGFSMSMTDPIEWELARRASRTVSPLLIGAGIAVILGTSALRARRRRRSLRGGTR